MKKLIFIFTMVISTVTVSLSQSPNGPGDFYDGCGIGTLPPTNGNGFYVDCVRCYSHIGDNGQQETWCNGFQITECLTCYGWALIDFGNIGIVFPGVNADQLDQDLRYFQVIVPGYELADGTTGDLYILTSDLTIETNDDGSRLNCTVIEHEIRR